jgi:hypothetical protein
MLNLIHKRWLSDEVVKKMIKSTKTNNSRPFNIQGDNPIHNITNQSNLGLNQVNNLDPNIVNTVNKIIPLLIKYMNFINTITKSSNKYWQRFIWIWGNKWRKRIWFLFKFILFASSGSVILFAPDPRAIFDNIISLKLVRDNIHFYNQEFFKWLMVKAGKQVNWEEAAEEGKKFFIVEKDKWALKLVRKPDSDQINNLTNNLVKTPVEYNNLIDIPAVQDDHNNCISRDISKKDIPLTIEQNSNPWYKDWKFLGGLTIGFAILGLAYFWYSGNLPDGSIPPSSPKTDQAYSNNNPYVDVVTDVLNNKVNKSKHLDKTIDKSIRSTLFKNRF